MFDCRGKAVERCARYIVLCLEIIPDFRYCSSAIILFYVYTEVFCCRLFILYLKFCCKLYIFYCKYTSCYIICGSFRKTVTIFISVYRLYAGSNCVVFKTLYVHGCRNFNHIRLDVYAHVFAAKPVTRHVEVR